jgi:hypothetical protein
VAEEYPALGFERSVLPEDQGVEPEMHQQVGDAGQNQDHAGRLF